jgi:outer membrane lipoprotein-sorting protein
MGTMVVSSEKPMTNISPKDSINYINDKFEKIKHEYSSAGMVSFDIEMIVESKIFDDIDSTAGEISIARDGRYYAQLNDDIFLFDGKCIWEYSTENNQATKQCLKSHEHFDSQLTFIKNLDEYYKTSVIEKDAVYRLMKIDNADESLPDTLMVYLKKTGLLKIEYLDLNDDLNKIYILQETVSDSLTNEPFKINLPDSVEIITLP